MGSCVSSSNKYYNLKFRKKESFMIDNSSSKIIKFNQNVGLVIFYFLL